MNTKVSLNQIQQDAEELFRKGDFFCSEAIVSSLRTNIDPDMPEQMISMASGFPVGVGRSKCMCGAVSGGVLGIGYFFGRTKGGDPKVNKTLELAREVQDRFQAEHKVSCCKILTKGMDMASGEHKAQCVRFTGEVARIAGEIIAREKGLELVEEAVAAV